MPRPTATGFLEVDSFTNTTGAGWHRDSGVDPRPLLPRRVAELRRLRPGAAVHVRLDLPPRRVEGREDQVQRSGHARLVPRHDVREQQPRPANTTTALPSTGSKGGLLLVDSHFDPFRRQGVAADKDPRRSTTCRRARSRPTQHSACRTPSHSASASSCSGGAVQRVLHGLRGTGGRSASSLTPRAGTPVSRFAERRSVLPRYRRLDRGAVRR